MSATGSTDQFNHKIYTSDEVVGWYDKLDMLLEPERVILEKLRGEITGKKLLDIGVGGGRTTKYLLEFSSDYTGIDYSPQFVELVKKKFSLENVFHCDARDMSRFADGAFDFVLFSFNSIDYIDHEGRIKALKEIRRVLKPGGVFMFSTHNRSWKDTGKLPWQLERRWTPGFFKDCLVTLLLSPRRARMKRLETHTDEYAILNDNAHNYSLLTYHISIPAQLRQLAALGFGDTEAYDMKGNRVSEDDQYNWTYFFTRKK